MSEAAVILAWIAAAVLVLAAALQFARRRPVTGTISGLGAYMPIARNPSRLLLAALALSAIAAVLALVGLMTA